MGAIFTALGPNTAYNRLLKSSLRAWANLMYPLASRSSYVGLIEAKVKKKSQILFLFAEYCGVVKVGVISGDYNLTRSHI